jgi:hypothetical protein
MAWRQQGSLWVQSPNSTAKALVQFIGGSGLGAKPQLSYRRLLDAMVHRGWAVQCWPFVPGFDHQLLASDACRAFRQAAARQPADLPILRLGHSMGCKLHLLAPDQGRGCAAQALMSFNNFAAERSIPLLGELAPRFGVSTEFSPDPMETLRLIANIKGPERQLVIRFRGDGLDQSDQLIQSFPGHSTLVELAGDHLTPASAGLRQQFLGGLGDGSRQNQLDRLADQITLWWNRRNNLRDSK